MLTDGVSPEPFHFPGGHVHRQFGAIGERRSDPLQLGVRLPEHYPDIEDHPGKETSSLSTVKRGE